MSEAHEKTRIRQLEDAAAHWEHKYTNARQYNRNLEERCKALEDLLRDAVPALSDHVDLSERARELLTPTSASENGPEVRP
jgi:predicted  nucleic acid-binding Zn-ribbon protein